MTAPTDHPARTNIRTQIDKSLLVEAAAGTGKTYELVQRMVAVLAAGARVDQLVAVTFTRKAAGELKIRLRQELDRARHAATDPETQTHLEAAVARLEEARIGTIHSFCAEILRERPVEAQVDPEFKELDEDEARRLYGGVFRRWMQEKLSALPPGLSRALQRQNAGPSDRPPIDRLAQAGYELVGWRDFPAPWKREPLDLAPNLDALTDRAVALAERSQGGDTRDYLYKGLEAARQFAAWLERAEEDAPRQYPVLEGRLHQLHKSLKRAKRKGHGPYREGVRRDDLLEEKDTLVRDLKSFLDRADADLAVVLQAELWEVVERYQAYKDRLGLVDFVDLLIKVRDLVRGNQAVRSYLQRRTSHLFIDEFQDTDPLQTEILLLLCADDPAESNWRRARPIPGKLFIVGDPKQSIYRFRRADVALYETVSQVLQAQDVELVHLGHSFRATAPLQAAINDAFAPFMAGEDGQSNYVALTGGPPALDTQPSLVALPVPYPHGRFGVLRSQVDACLPDTVAAFVDWLLNDSGFQVRDPEQGGAQGPIRPRHIAILFRRYMSFGKDITRAYVDPLEQRSVPHVLVGSRSFHQRDEIEAMRSVLNAIEWPNDELNVYAALRGPLFALPDDGLFLFRHAHGPLHTFMKRAETPSETEAPIFEALDILADLTEHRNDRPIVDTVHRLLQKTRARAGFALRPAGNQVLSNIQRLADMARSFEISGGISFRGFVDRVNQEADKPRSNESPVLEEGTEGVRLMTVHGAKGLEFPIVILADVTAPLAHKEPSRYLDTEEGLFATKLMGCAPYELLDHQAEEHALDEAEGIRLAYVAATRARDMLVVPTVGEGAKSLFWDDQKGWLHPLEPIVYPPKGNWRRPEPAIGVPITGDQTVLSLPPESNRPMSSVAPGLHRAEAGPEVVWLDPKTLTLEAPRTFGLRQEQFLAPDEEGRAEAGQARYHAWKEARAEAAELGEIQTILPLRAHEALVLPPDFDGLVETIRLPRSENRPNGLRFGTLVHLSLRDVELTADRAQVESIVKLHGRVLGASDEEVTAAIDPIITFLGHALTQRALAAETVFREYPIVLETDDGQALDGILDLVFKEPTGWVVIDYKTGLNDDFRKEQNHRQMAWYVHGLARLTDDEVIGILVEL